MFTDLSFRSLVERFLYNILSISLLGVYMRKNLFENAAFSNKFLMQKYHCRCVCGRFLKITVYFFVTRIILLNFAAEKMKDYE